MEERAQRKTKGRVEKETLNTTKRERLEGGLQVVKNDKMSGKSGERPRPAQARPVRK